MSEKMVLKVKGIEKAVELFMDLQKRYPMRSIEVYVYGCSDNERQDDDN